MAEQTSRPLTAEHREVDPTKLVPREKNARYMSSAEITRLVENVRRDGRLTSSVLVCQNADGSLELLSGHHRTKAAIMAGVAPIPAIVITDPLDEQQKVAIQLAHNAIAGQDDPSILADLYSALDLNWKKYSGLTDDDVKKFGSLSLDGVGSLGVKYEELNLIFLPADLEVVDEALKRFEKSGCAKRVMVARFEDFDAFFDAVVRTKRLTRVLNNASSIAIMTQLACERLDQLEAEAAGGDVEH